MASALRITIPAPPDSIDTVHGLIEYCVAKLPASTLERVSEKSDSAALAHKTDGNALYVAKDFIHAAHAFTKVCCERGEIGLFSH